MYPDPTSFSPLAVLGGRVKPGRPLRCFGNDSLPTYPPQSLDWVVVMPVGVSNVLVVVVVVVMALLVLMLESQVHVGVLMAGP